ncbi:pol protein [Cucumis melo var. makuwa]|uniref:Pol protein n=1 Tax=Cucumis melo var. makuwa TaxID=1194695 RepID=A0A5A7T662_CUCMM|nr:pol protein [Cucumis melo var. makuwa]TYK21231.1 pol protein [Cucumis melo var. makuwa]
MLGPELVQTTNAAIQKIRARMLTAQSKQKSYADERRRGKLASDIEGSVTCYMGTQFCFRVYVSMFQFCF